MAQGGTGRRGTFSEWRSAVFLLPVPAMVLLVPTGADAQDPKADLREKGIMGLLGESADRSGAAVEFGGAQTADGKAICYELNVRGDVYRTAVVFAGDSVGAAGATSADTALVLARAGDGLSTFDACPIPAPELKVVRVSDAEPFATLCKDARQRAMERVLILSVGGRVFGLDETIVDETDPDDDGTYKLLGGLIDCTGGVVPAVLGRSVTSVEIDGRANYADSVQEAAGELYEQLNLAAVLCDDKAKAVNLPAWIGTEDAVTKRSAVFSKLVKKAKVPKPDKRILKGKYDESYASPVKALAARYTRQDKAAAKALVVLVNHPDPDVASAAGGWLAMLPVPKKLIPQVRSSIEVAFESGGVGFLRDERYVPVLERMVTVLTKVRDRSSLPVFVDLATKENVPFRIRVAAAASIKTFGTSVERKALADYVASGWHFAWGGSDEDEPLNSVYAGIFDALEAAPADEQVRYFRSIASAPGPRARSKQAILRLVRLGDSGFAPQVEAMMRQVCPEGGTYSDDCRRDYEQAINLLAGN